MICNGFLIGRICQYANFAFLQTVTTSSLVGLWAILAYSAKHDLLSKGDALLGGPMRQRGLVRINFKLIILKDMYHTTF